jgi:hypothetical protein
MAGGPACRYDANNSAGQGGIPAGLYLYVDERSALEVLNDDGSVVNENTDIALGDIVNARDSFIGQVEAVAAKTGDAITSVLSGTLSVLLLAAALGFGIYFAIKNGGKE